MTERQLEITENFKKVRENIAAAVSKRGGGDVTLLAATKTVPAEDILFAAENLGLTAAGENRQQEFTEKYGVLSGALDYQFIGHLQTNKAKFIVGKASLIQSVDSLHLAERIGSIASAAGLVQDVLIEINIGREEAKSGFLPEEAAEAEARISELPGVRTRGIMVMAPVCSEKDEYRKYFRETYSIFIDIFQKKSHNIRECILSMGMSDSYVEAIEEGATLVRVGSALFGRRNYR
ncbi:MAG: YggS family pyridoxal phosphate-dependent enzyme [Clostridia bacterium]|nr:YggS family pyridoxal phosphate-dependent enzyme [Clostridia bacterium]MBR3415504.1 YggS family pyridoxal phosphate-dependent enzyme [Clostridia bacterium]